MSHPGGPPETRSVRKVALTALAATSIEWYDFFLYGTAAALIFPTVFFPAGLPPLVGLLASFSTFAVGFIARPIGAAVFGHFGDRLGRKRALVTALLMMGVATTLIGCLPSYALAGALAPLLLIVLRFVQGLAERGADRARSTYSSVSRTRRPSASSRRSRRGGMRRPRRSARGV